MDDIKLINSLRSGLISSFVIITYILSHDLFYSAAASRHEMHRTLANKCQAKPNMCASYHSAGNGFGCWGKRRE